LKLFSLILVTFLVSGTLTELVGQTLSEQPVSLAAVEKTAQPQPTQLEGLVTERKKYSFTITRGKIQYQIKIAENATIGLKMNKPWFDWENNQVVVDVLKYDPQADSIDLKAKSDKRFAINLPSKELFLISRFGDQEKIDQFKKAKTKRLNFYLITPEDTGQNFPSVEEPYLAGSLSPNGQAVAVDAGDSPIPVRLGFRYATMNGFSIMEMEPNKTQVFLTGVWAEDESEIVATRILFLPVIDGGRESGLPEQSTQ